MKYLSFLNSAMLLNNLGKLVIGDSAGNVANVEPPRGRLGRGGRLFRHRGKGWSPETVSCGEKKGSQVGRGESHGKENVSGKT